MRQKWILISIAAVLLLGGVLGSWYVLGHKQPDRKSVV